MEREKATEGMTKLELKKLRRLEKKKARKVAAEELKKKCVRVIDCIRILVVRAKSHVSSFFSGSFETRAAIFTGD